VPRQQVAQHLQVGSVGAARHADHARAERGEAREHHEPRRVLDEHGFASGDEMARDQIDPLRHAAGRDDLR
jgi:hypothetical protein